MAGAGAEPKYGERKKVEPELVPYYLKCAHKMVLMVVIVNAFRRRGGNILFIKGVGRGGDQM